VSAILASRLELEADTILDSIPDEARRTHAEKVLSDVLSTMADHEARRPVAEALDEVVRTLERVRTHLDAADESPSGIDLAQVAAAREALAAVREAMPEPAPQDAEAPIRVSTCILAGLLIGAVVWLVR
jgi:hypothetical protein